MKPLFKNIGLINVFLPHSLHYNQHCNYDTERMASSLRIGFAIMPEADKHWRGLYISGLTFQA